MKVAVMQPYFFPYLGYFQLLASVDHFVFLDDVNFIKKGFIHRNALLAGHSRLAFTLPVSDISQNRAINQHDYTGDFAPFLHKLEHCYQKAANFASVYALVQRVLNAGTCNVAGVNRASVLAVCEYLGVTLNHGSASDIENPDGLRAQARIIQLCHHVHASHYHNAIGGTALYQHQAFRQAGLELAFIQPVLTPYPQHSPHFEPGLSIIDLLMHLSPEACREYLSQGKVVREAEHA